MWYFLEENARLIYFLFRLFQFGLLISQSLKDMINLLRGKINKYELSVKKDFLDF